jgi:acyl-coenzyme A synthetase/AMP-(fatty) acid ligase
LLYGLTEACGLTVRPAHEGPCRDGEMGEPLPGVRLVVRGGELHARAPWLFCGYFGDPDATARVLVDVEGEGVMLRTGDLVRREGDGYRYLGRADDVFKTHGHRANPGEVERVVTELPTVDVAVALPVAGSTGHTEVRLVYAGEADPAEVLARCRQSLPPWLVPGTVDRREEPWPRTAMGKIDRTRL